MEFELTTGRLRHHLDPACRLLARSGAFPCSPGSPVTLGHWAEPEYGILPRNAQVSRTGNTE